jgi:hypothetical protein
MSTSVLRIHADRVEELHHALLLHRRDEALEIVARIAKQPDQPDLIAWARSHHVGERIGDPDTRWVLEEIAAHLAEGRCEHALCLVERYGGYYANSALPSASALPKGRKAA